MLGCTNTRDASQNAPVSAQRFSPQAGNSITLLRRNASNTELDTQVSFSPLRKQLPDSAHVFNVLQKDLNNDQFEEQIVVFKQENTRSDAISILVYSSDIRYEDALFEWQSETKASELRSFVIRFENIDTDRNLEIICTGIDANGFHTIDVYKSYTAVERPGVFLYSLLSLVSPLGIDINQEKASLDSAIGSTTSFVHYDINDEEDAHPLDRIETVYTWNPQENAYTVSNVNLVNGEIQEQLDHGLLANYTTRSLVAALPGIWYADTGNILYFDADTNSIVLSKKEIQEWYIVISAYKTIRNTYPSLRITMHNDLLFTVQSNLYVSFIDFTTIEVFSDVENESNGIYKRLDDHSENGTQDVHLLQNRQEDPHIDHAAIMGIYKNSKGDELYLDENSFIFTYEGILNRGNYILYEFFRPVLELTYIDSKTKELTGKKFALIATQENNLVKTIELVPIRINARSISFLGEQPIVLDRQE